MMDLLHRNHAEFAWRLLNAIQEASGDYAGAAVLDFYLTYRAAVRAKVCAIRTSQKNISAPIKADEREACRSYLSLALKCQKPRRAALIITHGLPGSGKTTFSQMALQQLGAIRIRSDVERKRLYGLGALESSRARTEEVYGVEATQRTSARLCELAQGLLRAGHTVIVDAAFLKREERERFRELATSMSVPFAIASLQASDATLRARIRKRRNDASEADISVLEKLLAALQPLSEAELDWSVCFTTEQSPRSKYNMNGWAGLLRLTTAEQERTIE